MERERTVRCLPPRMDCPVLGSRAVVRQIAWEPELDVVARWFTSDVREVSGNVVAVRILLVPGTVSLFTVRVDVGYDPPLIARQEVVVLRQGCEIRDEMPQQARADGFVCMTSRQEAHACFALPETERAHRAPLPGTAQHIARTTRHAANSKNFANALVHETKRTVGPSRTAEPADPHARTDPLTVPHSADDHQPVAGTDDPAQVHDALGQRPGGAPASRARVVGED